MLHIIGTSCSSLAEEEVKAAKLYYKNLIYCFIGEMSTVTRNNTKYLYVVIGATDTNRGRMIISLTQSFFSAATSWGTMDGEIEIQLHGTNKRQSLKNSS